MAYLQSILLSALYWIKWLSGLAVKTTSLSPRVYYALHYVFVILVIILLSVFSDDIISLFPDLALPTSITVIREHWCGLLGLLLYLFGRLLYYLISLFWLEEESEFIDIDRAWAEGMKGLAAAGLDVQGLPLFLGLGLSARDESQFYMAAKFGWKVTAPSIDNKASPLRFYANHDAIFVSCSNVSTICSQADLLPDGPVMLNRPAAAEGDPTLQPGDIEQMMDPELLMTLKPGQTSEIKRGAPAAVVAARQDASRGGRMLYPSELAICRRRLEHLCRLIAQDRAPQCPINGLLAAIPLEWVGSASDRRLVTALEQDVVVLHEQLRQMFPVVCVWTGLQRLGNVNELVERVRTAERKFGPEVRAGSSCPVGLLLDESSSQWLADKGLEWFRAWIYKAFAHDLSNASNPQLYRLMCQLDERREGIVELLYTTFGESVLGERIRLAGSYFCAVDSRSRQHAFVRGVFSKLLDEQNGVAYPRVRTRSDQWYRVAAYVCCVAICLLILADAYLATTWWRNFE